MNDVRLIELGQKVSQNEQQEDGNDVVVEKRIVHCCSSFHYQYSDLQYKCQIYITKNKIYWIDEGPYIFINAVHS